MSMLEVQMKSLEVLATKHGSANHNPESVDDNPESINDNSGSVGDKPRSTSNYYKADWEKHLL